MTALKSQKDADAAARQPAATGADPAAATDPQTGDDGTPAAANRGSPAASVMKQFAKTQAEGTGRP